MQIIQGITIKAYLGAIYIAVMDMSAFFFFRLISDLLSELEQITSMNALLTNMWAICMWWQYKNDVGVLTV